MNVAQNSLCNFLINICFAALVIIPVLVYNVIRYLCVLIYIQEINAITIYGGAVGLSNLKWIPLSGLDLSAENLAAAEKLRKFGFAVNCGEFGSDKYIKSALCVYDVLEEQKTPNVLIIAPNSELYNWYRVLITLIGADFKIITETPNSLVFFNEGGASLFLMSKEALFTDNVLKKKISKRFLWNLIIIDEEQNCTVPNYGEYEKHLIWNSQRLLINTSFPARTTVESNGLKSLIKSVLDSGELSAKADGITFSENASEYSENSSVMRYYKAPVYSDNFKRNISYADYDFDEAEIAGFRRKMDLRSGLPAYSYGGNVFEMYDCDKYDKEKKIYAKPFFSRSELEDILAFDKKLDCLVNLCTDLLKDEKNRVMIYCCDKNTVDYLQKALSCMYGAVVRTTRGGLVRSDDITRKLSVKTDEDPARIIIGIDELGTAVSGMSSINVVVNYELPSSPVLLERRVTRHGFEGESERKFILFRDKNGIFDTGILKKSLFLQLADAFCGELPTRNILLDIENRGEILSSLVAELKSIKDTASKTDSCLDLVKQVKNEYNVPAVQRIQNGKQLADFSEEMLDNIYGLFGIDEKSSAEEISASINALSGLCVIKNGKLCKADNREQMANSFGGDAYANLPFASEAVKGLSEAKQEIDELHKSDDFHLQIKREISELGDCIQYPVLFGIWKYRAKEQDSDRSFKDYIKIYNDGF